MHEAHHRQVEGILRADPIRWNLLKMVSDLDLPDCWIAAGFIRNAVWDALHGRTSRSPVGDVDVIWFGLDGEEVHDRKREEALRTVGPSIDWSVKNQARMNTRNGDASCQSATDAMRFWPETARAVAARRSGMDHLEIASPIGLDDLLNLVLRPTSRLVAEKRYFFEERVRSKAWTTAWPMLSRAEPVAA